MSIHQISKTIILLLLLSIPNISYTRDLLGITYLNEVSFKSATSCLVWVYGTSDSGAIPACAENGSSRLVFDMCTETGKAWLSIILTYQAQNKTMKIRGSGLCDLYSTTESVSYLRLSEGG